MGIWKRHVKSRRIWKRYKNPVITKVVVFHLRKKQTKNENKKYTLIIIIRDSEDLYLWWRSIFIKSTRHHSSNTHLIDSSIAMRSSLHLFDNISYSIWHNQGIDTINALTWTGGNWTTFELLLFVIRELECPPRHLRPRCHRGRPERIGRWREPKRTIWMVHSSMKPGGMISIDKVEGPLENIAWRDK